MNDEEIVRMVVAGIQVLALCIPLGFWLLLCYDRKNELKEEDRRYRLNPEYFKKATKE
tara:strand:- start:337 stop:510 length:174 start_codon:yes stop_codon:yes gene_type:complete